MDSRSTIDSDDDEGVDLLEEVELLFPIWWYYHHVWLRRRHLPHRQHIYPRPRRLPTPACSEEITSQLQPSTAAKNTVATDTCEQPAVRKMSTGEQAHQQRLVSGNAWVQNILANEKDCYDTFRMRRDQFLSLHKVLVDRYGLRTTNNVSSEECLAIFLYIISGPHSTRSAANTFGHSISTISIKFRHALRRIYNLGVDIIKPTDSTFAQPHPKVRSGAYYPWFENCIGALDGAHFRLQVSGERNTNLIGRHMVPTFNVLAIADLDCRFIFVSSGHPGSMNDYTLLQQTLEQYHDHFPHPPQDKFYLVDAAYGNITGFLGPYRNTRYHLQHFEQGQLLETMEELFNYRHAQLRCSVERAFWQLKNKFRILKSIPNFGLRISNQIIVAAMALHNFIKDTGGDSGCDWTQTSMDAGNNESIEPDLPDLMEQAGSDADEACMDRLRDLIASGMAASENLF